MNKQKTKDNDNESMLWQHPAIFDNDPLIKSPAPIQHENTQDTQDNQFSALSEDKE